jgi:hypothetical protein
MPNDPKRRTIIDRANRMLKRSRRLRKIADELLDESNDLKSAASRLLARTAGRGENAKRPTVVCVET